MPCPRLLSVAVAAAIAWVSPTAIAGNLPADHPTAALVKKYFENVVEQNWKGAAEMINPESIERKRADTIERLKRAPTITEEKAVLKQFGVADIRDLEKMTPVEFFVADRKYFHNPASVTPDIIAQKRKSLKVEVLGIVGETNDTIAHLVVRTSQDVVDQRIIELVFISFLQDEKDKSKWLISPDMQRPTTVPLEGAAKPAEDKKADAAPKK